MVDQPNDAIELSEAVSNPIQATAPSFPELEVTHSALPKRPSGKLPADPPTLTDQTYYLPTKQIFIAFIGLSLALGCSLLDLSIVSTALPSISAELQGGRDSSWVATAYLLTSLAFTPLYGRWSDIFGRKTVLVGSLIIFWIFSLACALAQSMVQLIIFRALKGIGGGAIMTLVFIITADIVPLAKRGKYQSFIEIISACCNGIGPILGGIFSQSTTWRWSFWINLPLCGLAIVTTIWLIPLEGVEGNMKEKFMRIDYVGSAVAIAASTLLILWLTWGGVKYSWISAPVLVLVFISLALFVAFFCWEAKYARLPIIPMKLFRNLSLVAVFIVSSCSFTALFIVIFYVPQLLQILRNATPIEAGVLMLSFLLPIPVSVFANGLILDHFGRYKPTIVVGFAIWTIAQGLATTIDGSSSKGKIAGILVMAAVGAGGTFQTTLIAAQAMVPRSEMAVTTGTRHFFRLLASAIGLAISSSILNNTLRSSMIQDSTFTPSEMITILDDPTAIHRPELLQLTPAQKSVILDAYTVGFQAVFYMTVGICGAAVLVSFFIKQLSLDREEDRDIKEKVKEKLREAKVQKTMQPPELERQQ